MCKMIKTNLMYYAEMLYWIYFIHLNIVLLVLLLFYLQSRFINCWFCIIDIAVLFSFIKKFSFTTARSLDFCAFIRYLHPSQSRSPGFCVVWLRSVIFEMNLLIALSAVWHELSDKIKNVLNMFSGSIYYCQEVIVWLY